MSSDFDGLPLVGGSIYGIRAWRQNHVGALVSPQRTNFLWRDGENIAQCDRPKKVKPQENLFKTELEGLITKHYLPKGAKIVGMLTEQQQKRSFGWDKFIVRVTFFVETDVVGHPSDGFPNEGYVPKTLEWVDGGYTGSLSFYWSTLAQHMDQTQITHDFEDCVCGFYAYTKTENVRAGMKYLSRDAYGYGAKGFSGVIEGYGTVTMGPYGFRAEKARIVAMFLPDMMLITEMSARFPSVLFFDSEKKMLDEFPLGVRDLAA